MKNHSAFFSSVFRSYLGQQQGIDNVTAFQQLKVFRGRKWLSTLIVFTFIITFTCCSVTASSDGKEKPICDTEEWQDYPAIYADRVVWTDGRDGQSMDIYLYDISTGVEMPVCTADGHQSNPALYGDYIVWEDGRNDDLYYDIYLYDISSGIETPICTANFDQLNPAIYGDRIIWQDNRNGDYDLYLYDISRDEIEDIYKIDGNQEEPVIYKDWIVWQDDRNGGYDIYLYDVNRGVEWPVCTADGDQTSPAIYGDWIVWADYRNGDNSDIYLYDISTGVETPVCTAKGSQFQPAIYKNLIAWTDEREGEYMVHLYDIPSESEIFLDISGVNPIIYEDRIVWVDRHNDEGDIFSISVPFGFQSDVKADNQSDITDNPAQTQTPQTTKRDEDIQKTVTESSDRSGTDPNTWPEAKTRVTEDGSIIYIDTNGKEHDSCPLQQKCDEPHRILWANSIDAARTGDTQKALLYSELALDFAQDAGQEYSGDVTLLEENVKDLKSRLE